MKQRVAIARALAMEPEILFMDEPFSSVDAFTRDNLHENLVKLWEELKITIVFITHSIDEAIRLSTRIIGKAVKTTLAHIQEQRQHTRRTLIIVSYAAYAILMN